MASTVFKLSNKVRTKIFSYLEGEYTTVYEKAYLFDNHGQLVDKWIGIEGSIDIVGLGEKVEKIKNEGNYPIFIHTHPSMQSFSDLDFTRIILDVQLAPMAQWISTRHINFMLVPKEKTFLYGRRKTIAYLRKRRKYIAHDKEATRLLKEKAFVGTDFPNAYKYFWNSYVGASVADFIGADFYAIPVDKMGGKYCKLIKKGLKVLGNLELKTN
jgi:hypothetical protein